MGISHIFLYINLLVLFPEKHGVGIPIRDGRSWPVVGGESDVEDQGAVRLDAAVDLRAITQLMRDIDLPSVANPHMLQSRGETIDPTTDGKFGRREDTAVESIRAP